MFSTASSSSSSAVHPDSHRCLQPFEKVTAAIFNLPAPFSTIHIVCTDRRFDIHDEIRKSGEDLQQADQIVGESRFTLTAG